MRCLDFFRFRWKIRFFHILTIIATLNLFGNGYDRSYILIECDAGFSNRLRVLAAYVHVAKELYNNSEIVMIWDTNESCNGQFLQAFEPIPQVTFTTSNSRHTFEAHALKRYPNTDVDMARIFELNNLIYNKSYFHFIQLSLYANFIPIPDLNDIAIEFIRSHNICYSGAIHVRRTDLDAHHAIHDGWAKSMRTSDEDFFKFINNLPPDVPVYLLTDNRHTQLEFLSKYGEDRIIVYHNIDENTTLSVSRSHYIRGSDTNGNLREHHRFTSLLRTMLDIIIATHSRYFMGTFFSSLSALIHIFRDLRRANDVCPLV